MCVGTQEGDFSPWESTPSVLFTKGRQIKRGPITKCPSKKMFCVAEIRTRTLSGEIPKNSFLKERSFLK